MAEVFMRGITGWTRGFVFPLKQKNEAMMQHHSFVWSSEANLQDFSCSFLLFLPTLQISMWLERTFCSKHVLPLHLKMTVGPTAESPGPHRNGKRIMWRITNSGSISLLHELISRSFRWAWNANYLMKFFHNFISFHKKLMCQEKKAYLF